jgi:hypothetical protein
LLAIQQFAVKPRLGEKAFAKKARVQRDRYDVSLRNIKATDINFEKLANGEIDMAALSANNNSIKIYRDISNPLDSIRKVGGYPHQLLYKMKMPVRINKVTFSDSYISYKERNGLSDSSGNLFFDHSTISLANVTNHPTGANKIMNMDVDLNLLGRVPLAVNIKFYLDKVKEGHYHVNAVANKSFNGVLLNQITMPMGLKKIEKGTVNGLSIQFMADNINAQGELTVKYEGLKISLMKRDKKGGAFDKKGIISLLANLVVKNNNPANGKLRTAEVVYKRDEYKSFFNMIWKFAFNGLKDVMGAKL